MNQNKLKVLIVGGGGREHAIAWKLSQSPRIETIICAPGNAGISEIAECAPIQADDIESLIALAKSEAIDLAIIGPEGPLAAGIVDEFERQGVRVFGPNKKCAQLEASKAFTKQFLERHSIPTAGYREFTDLEAAISAIGLYGFPMVIKADGLAAGKGVIIAEDSETAEVAIRELMGARIFGSAGDKLVIEEFLTGTEASVLCFVDGKTIVPMASAQDYKKIHDGDQGPNTGGMGTYSPSLIFNADLELAIRNQILNPTLSGFQRDGLDFRGVLFIGVMIGADGPKVIEFNVRFGDPETQSVLMRLETDLLDIMDAVIDGRLAEQRIDWSEDRTICVVLAAGGYPGNYGKGDVINGFGDLPADILVFHAGTRFAPDAAGGRIVTAGGRVLGVCGRGKTAEEARERVYNHIDKINFHGMQYRKDIGIIVEQNQGG
jgi:phosphoribosylamine--glycine ligase